MKKQMILFGLVGILSLGGLAACRSGSGDPSADTSGTEASGDTAADTSGTEASGDTAVDTSGTETSANPTMDTSGTETLTDSSEDENNLGMVDGDFTYVDNEKLLQVIAGNWKSADGRWKMTIGEDYEIQLTLDREDVLSDTLDFVYLQPGQVFHTEFNLNSQTLAQGDGTTIGEIELFYHEAGENGGRIFMEIAYEKGDSVTLEFQKL